MGHLDHQHEDHNHEHAPEELHTHEHTHTHTHEHTHDDGVTHTHPHEHTHEHEHVHVHGDGGKVDGQTLAVLQYMLDHNIHHAAELSDLAEQLAGEARHQMLHAVESFDQANGYLSHALDLLKAEQ